MKKKAVKVVHGVNLENLSNEQINQLRIDTCEVQAAREAIDFKKSTAEFRPQFEALVAKLTAAMKKKIVFDLVIPVKVTATVSADLTELYRNEMAENFQLDLDVTISKSKLTKDQKDSFSNAISDWVADQSDYNAEYLWDLMPADERAKFSQLNDEVIKFSDVISKQGLDLEEFCNVQ